MRARRGSGAAAEAAGGGEKGGGGRERGEASSAARSARRCCCRHFPAGRSPARELDPLPETLGSPLSRAGGVSTRLSVPARQAGGNFSHFSGERFGPLRSGCGSVCGPRRGGRTFASDRGAERRARVHRPRREQRGGAGPAVAGMKLSRQFTVFGSAVFCVVIFSLYLMLDRGHFDHPKSPRREGTFPKVSGAAAGARRTEVEVPPPPCPGRAAAGAPRRGGDEARRRRGRLRATPALVPAWRGAAAGAGTAAATAGRGGWRGSPGGMGRDGAAPRLRRLRGWRSGVRGVRGQDGESWQLGTSAVSTTGRLREMLTWWLLSFPLSRALEL